MFLRILFSTRLKKEKFKLGNFQICQISYFVMNSHSEFIQKQLLNYLNVPSHVDQYGSV